MNHCGPINKAHVHELAIVTVVRCEENNATSIDPAWLGVLGNGEVCGLPDSRQQTTNYILGVTEVIALPSRVYRSCPGVSPIRPPPRIACADHLSDQWSAGNDRIPMLAFQRSTEEMNISLQHHTLHYMCTLLKVAISQPRKIVCHMRCLNRFASMRSTTEYRRAGYTVRVK